MRNNSFKVHFHKLLITKRKYVFPEEGWGIPLEKISIDCDCPFGYQHTELRALMLFPYLLTFHFSSSVIVFLTIFFFPWKLIMSGILSNASNPSVFLPLFLSLGPPFWSPSSCRSDLDGLLSGPMHSAALGLPWVAPPDPLLWTVSGTVLCGGGIKTSVSNGTEDRLVTDYLLNDSMWSSKCYWYFVV